MEDTSESLKARIGWTAYVPAGLKNLLVERFRAHLSFDGGPADRRAGPAPCSSATAAS